MHFVLSGEGRTDIGQNINGDFIAGTMYFIIDKIIEKKWDYSIYESKNALISFVPKVELTKLSKKLPPFTGKKVGKNRTYFINNAISLAKSAKIISKGKDDEVIAILFRDSDGTRSDDKKLWSDKVDSIKVGFAYEKFESGVAMIPKPKSEAWLLCPLEKNYQHCEKLELLSGNDKSPNPIKKILEHILDDNKLSYDDIDEMIQDNRIDIDKIDMPSFNAFRDRLEELL